MSVGYQKIWQLAGKRLAIVSILAGFFQFGGRALAADEPEHLNIVWETSGGRKVPKLKKREKELFDAWKTGCANLGKALTVEQGPWGLGAFTSITCLRDATIISGKKSDSPWTLKFIHGEERTQFIILKKSGDVETIQSDVSFKGSEWSMTF